MKAEVIEKGDGTLTVRYTAVNPVEAMIVAACSMGVDEHTAVTLGSTTVYLAGASFKVIAQMRPEEK